MPLPYSGEFRRQIRARMLDGEPAKERAAELWARRSLLPIPQRDALESAFTVGPSCTLRTRFVTATSSSVKHKQARTWAPFHTITTS